MTVACDMFVAVVVASDSDSTVDCRDSEPELQKVVKRGGCKVNLGLTQEMEAI